MKVFRQKSLEKHPYLQRMANHLIITTDFFRWADCLSIINDNHHRFFSVGRLPINH